MPTDKMRGGKQPKIKSPNVPDGFDTNSLKPNSYYWIRTERTPWFPAKWVCFQWYVAGVMQPLATLVVEIDQEIVHS